MDGWFISGLVNMPRNPETRSPKAWLHSDAYGNGVGTERYNG
jgi:hypothetical protein